jgi:hypothetical protein
LLRIYSVTVHRELAQEKKTNFGVKKRKVLEKNFNLSFSYYKQIWKPYIPQSVKWVIMYKNNWPSTQPKTKHTRSITYPKCRRTTKSPAPICKNISVSDGKNYFDRGASQTTSSSAKTQKDKTPLHPKPTPSQSPNLTRWICQCWRGKHTEHEM